MIAYSNPNALIYIPYARVNCLKTIPFKAAHTYMAHIWQYPSTSPPTHGPHVPFNNSLLVYASLNLNELFSLQVRRQSEV